MTLEEFTAEFEGLMLNDEEKAAVLLAGEQPELYRRYWIEYLEEDPADLEL